MKRKPKFVLPTKYILLILSGVCIVAILLSFTLGISGGPLNTVAGYVFIPMPVSYTHLTLPTTSRV